MRLSAAVVNMQEKGLATSGVSTRERETERTTRVFIYV